MKAELLIDIKELAQQVAVIVIEAIRPELQARRQEPDLFTVETLAKYLRVSQEWIYERVQRKEIPHFKMGEKLLRFRKHEIDQWLDSQAVQACNPLSRPLKALPRKARGK